MRIVLAYSGGLDTSVILRWLQIRYDAKVVAFNADVGQGEDMEQVRRKAEALGAEHVLIEDLRHEFVRDYVSPMFRANALYEASYLLGTAIARPLIAKRQVEVARAYKADALAHGATGKGNDQVRFELAYHALGPELRVLAPWRTWEFQGRESLLAWAREHQVPISKDKEGEAPFSVDANLLHVSAEGKILEDPSLPAPEKVFSRTCSPEQAPDKPTALSIEFHHGNPVSVNLEALAPHTLLEKLNQLGGENAIGRLDLVENRFLGMKSRGVYETPGGTLWLFARRALESLTLDRELAHLRDSLMPRYAELVYNGLWFSPEREAMQAFFDSAQERVSGCVRLKLYKGTITLLGRESPNSLYSPQHATFEADKVYNPRDAEGFIKITALRLKLGATTPIAR